ncbi:hypothetical protein Nmel_004113 [Mimus melanotis]
MSSEFQSIRGRKQKENPKAMNFMDRNLRPWLYISALLLGEDIMGHLCPFHIAQKTHSSHTTTGMTLAALHPSKTMKKQSLQNHYYLGQCYIKEKKHREEVQDKIECHDGKVEEVLYNGH